MKAWDILQCDEGSAVVVPPGTEPIDALIHLVKEECGGETWSRTNPTLVEAAENVRIQIWYSCTKAWKQNNWVDEPDDPYWAPDGDGKRTLLVAYYDGNTYALGDDAQAHEKESTP